MSSLSKKEVHEIAWLARLDLDEKDTLKLSEQLGRILDFVSQMKVDTESISPLAHPLDLGQRLREDRVTEENQRDEFQSVAPQVENGLYLVPKVIE